MTLEINDWGMDELGRQIANRREDYAVCAIRDCEVQTRFRQTLCTSHWMLVPAGLRRHISKCLRKNDMVPDITHWELEKKAVGFVYKKMNRPPHPAEVR